MLRVSLVVLPFKREDLDVVEANLRTAARNDRVEAVWAVGAGEGGDLDAVASVAGCVATEEDVPVEVFAQERISRFPSGKGDGMNTTFCRAAPAGLGRSHFYDADLANFDGDW